MDYSASGFPHTTYAYDDGGRPLTIIDAAGTTSFTYDTAGHLASETDGDSATVSYEYDDNGRLIQITYPGSRDLDYDYDAAGQMTEVKDWSDRTTTFGWTDDGQLETRTDPNGVVETTTYDDAGRTALIEDSASGMGVLASFGYGYDDAGQLVSDVTTNGGVTTTHAYAYDALSQLGDVTTAPAGLPATTASFDATSGGQLVGTAGGDTLTYNSAQELTDLVPDLVPAVSFDYDDRGSRTSSTIAAVGPTPAATTTYGYGPTGALTSVDTPAVDIEYTVDARGLRQSRDDGSSTDDFVWSTVSGLPLLLADGDHAYIYGPSLTPIAQVDGSDDIEYLHRDLIGSVRAISNDSGVVVGVSNFDPFGERSYHYGVADSRFGYSGNWTDPDTGLIHLRARDYDPATGQFLTVDPAVDSTQQPYAYTGNSPLQRSDPSGLDFMSSLQSVVGQVAQVVTRAAIAGYRQFAATTSCAIEQAGAFALGGLDSFTYGISGLLLGAAVPGYNDFVADHDAAFAAGSIAVTVIQTAFIIATTAGAATGAAIALIAAKVAAKAALKAEAKAVVKAEARTLVQLTVRSADNATVAVGGGSTRAAVKAQDEAVTYLYQKLDAAGQHLKYGTTKNPATRYTRSEMNGGSLNILASGAKSDMLSLERSVHEWLPIGPAEGQGFYILKQVASGLRPPPY